MYIAVLILISYIVIINNVQTLIRDRKPSVRLNQGEIVGVYINI